MAVTVTLVFQGADTSIFNVTATLDADTTATIPHGLGAVPQEIYITWQFSNAGLSLWFASASDGTNVTLTKATTAGSGSANPQVKCIIKRPHSIGR